MLAERKKLSIYCAAAAAVLIAGCGGGSANRHHRGSSGAGGPQAVPISTAAPATVKPTSQIAGIIAPYQNVSISSALSEPTSIVTVIQGDHVRAGQVLARLDVSDLQANYVADERAAVSSDAKAVQAKYTAQLNLGQGNYQVSSSLAAMRNAKLVYVQDESLYKEGYVSEATLEAARATYVNAEQTYNTAVLNAQVNGNNEQGLQAATVASAIADAQSAHAQADQIEAEISRSVITTPVDGIIVNRNLNPGEYPGSRTIFTVQQLDPVYAELNASSSNVFLMTRGLPVQIAVSGVNGVSYTGKVSAVLGQVEPGSTNFTVEVIVPNPGDKLQSGMAVTGTVTLPTVSGVGIPTNAFLDDSHTSIMVVSSDGTAKQQSVKELGSNGTTSIVTGVANGTQVIANGQLGITAGEEVADVNASPSPGASAAASSDPSASMEPSPGASPHHRRHKQP
jgi:HlyD family secretion protein